MYGYKTKDNEHSLLEYSLRDRQPSDALLEVTAALDKLPQNARVVNLGCGDGSLELLAGNNRTYSFTSIDLEPTAIKTLTTFFQNHGHKDDVALVGDITELNEVQKFKSSSPFDASVSWRVLHGIDPIHYHAIMSVLHTHLKPGASFYISVASDQDWKVSALGQRYNPQGVNDCASVMFHDFGIERRNPFPVHFFSANELEELGKATGFKVDGISYFQESSGYTHLQDRLNTYVFARFINS